jgi:predicted acyltransferase
VLPFLSTYNSEKCLISAGIPMTSAHCLVFTVDFVNLGFQTKTNPMNTPKHSDRLLSLDALRGFDMLWIIGGGELAMALAKVTDWGWLNWFAEQQHHVKWEGFHFEDLIFPLFMFISGVAISFAILGKVHKGGSKSKTAWKVVRRGITLVLLGFVYNGILQLHFVDGEQFRFASVLGQIGLGYLFASLIVLFTRHYSFRLMWLGGILLGYAIIQNFIPVPGIGACVLTPEGCINGYIDRAFLPGRLHGEVFDPEGLLCIVSATGITLMGALAGEVLRSKMWSEYRKLMILSGTGVGFILIALLLSPVYPIIKAAWTTTFNLLAGGISLLLLSLFYLVIDIWKFHRWSFFFTVIGMNSITIYIGSHIIDFGKISKFFLGGLVNISGADWGNVIFWIGFLAAEWGFLLFLYRRKIFLRV